MLPCRCQWHGTWIPCERNQWWGGAELAHLGWLFICVSSSVHPYVVIVVHSCVVVVIIHQLLVAMLPTAAWPLHLMWERRGGEESCYSPEYCGQWWCMLLLLLFIHWVSEVVLPGWSIIILCFSKVGWEECGGYWLWSPKLHNNDEWWSLFIVWLPHCPQQCGTWILH